MTERRPTNWRVESKEWKSRLCDWIPPCAGA